MTIRQTFITLGLITPPRIVRTSPMSGDEMELAGYPVAAWHKRKAEWFA